LKKSKKSKRLEEVEEAVVVERTTKIIIFIVGNGRIRQSVQVHFHYYFSLLSYCHQIPSGKFERGCLPEKGGV
jgi:hypothetical protein